MRKLIVFTLILLSSICIYGKVVASFEEISKPQMMSINEDYLLITEGHSIFVYSTKDYSLIKKFGRAGEGPKEFKISRFGTPMIAYFYKNEIFVSSDSKISFFSHTGNFIKEMKIPPFTLFRPFMNQYVATGTSTNNDNQNVLVINLHNSNLKKIKELYKSDMSIGPNAFFTYPISNFSFEPYKNNLFIVRGKEGFVIEVLSKEGKTLYTIKKDFEKIKVSNEYRNKTFKSFETNPNFKQFSEFFKKRTKFKKYYPAIQDIRVTDDRIYVITFKKQKGKTRCVVLDLKGKELKKVWVPYPELHGMDYLPEYDIFNKKFYILIENEDEELWELHVINL